MNNFKDHLNADLIIKVRQKYKMLGQILSSEKRKKGFSATSPHIHEIVKKRSRLSGELERYVCMSNMYEELKNEQALECFTSSVNMIICSHMVNI